MSEGTLILASHGRRFCTLIADLTIFLILRAISIPLLEHLGIIRPWVGSDGDMLNVLILYPGSVVMWGIYYFLFECFLRGKTPGKYLTGTRAVTLEGGRVNWESVFVRTFARLIPLDPLSALSDPCYPWHDRWASSLVVDERRSKLTQLPPWS